jgi:hypothetical protein
MKYTQKYGKPEGNEFLYGNYILRQIQKENETQFWIVDQFETVNKACNVYRSWISENPEAFQSTWRKIVLANNHHHVCGYKCNQIIK